MELSAKKSSYSVISKCREKSIQSAGDASHKDSSMVVASLASTTFDPNGLPTVPLARPPPPAKQFLLTAASRLGQNSQSDCIPRLVCLLVGFGHGRRVPGGRQITLRPIMFCNTMPYKQKRASLNGLNSTSPPPSPLTRPPSSCDPSRSSAPRRMRSMSIRASLVHACAVAVNATVHLSVRSMQFEQSGLSLGGRVRGARGPWDSDYFHIGAGIDSQTLAARPLMTRRRSTQINRQ